MDSFELREKLLSEAMEKLKVEAGRVVGDIMGDLYCSYLPYVVTDTDANIGNRVDGVVKNLISGKMRQVSESMVAVSDGYESEHYIHINSYDAMVKPLCELMGEQIVSARVRQLEIEVQSLKEQLKQAWGR